MAFIGIFALNLSPKSGGVFSLMEGLMTHASYSRHQFLYLAPTSAVRGPLPVNVRLVDRPQACRAATQALLSVPGIDRLLGNGATSVALLAGASAAFPRLFTEPVQWLWPHTFRPVPSLPRVSAICHDMIHWRYPEYYSRIALAMRRRSERSMAHCRRILCPSQATAADLVKVYPYLEKRTCCFSEAPVNVLSKAECAAELRELEWRFKDIPLFVCVAVDWPHKNHNLLLKAATDLRRRTDRAFKVVFVGHRRGNSLSRAIAHSGLGEIVVDLGPASSEMVAALYHRSVALLFPSRCEGFGLPLVEAMYCRLPIVASDVSCMPEVCADAAVLLNPEDPAAWAESMLRLLTDPVFRSNLAERSEQRGLSFSWTRTWAKLDTVFDEAGDDYATQTWRDDR